METKYDPPDFPIKCCLNFSDIEGTIVCDFAVGSVLLECAAVACFSEREREIRAKRLCKGHTYEGSFFDRGALYRAFVGKSAEMNCPGFGL